MEDDSTAEATELGGCLIICNLLAAETSRALSIGLGISVDERARMRTRKARRSRGLATMAWVSNWRDGMLEAAERKSHPPRVQSRPPLYY